ncbi:cobalt-precorrin 5A hydrolase [Clostridium pasteurianum]|uniref:Cobalamin biosynthesis protein CbiG n=1 Tax=Clostridium pasteurianum BC1 TaxID=86416 RepID=R4K6S0_CLOPA|nr:cobalt-precorrin 5A hydrolase [Clostridium pasteurianum]AGK96209.1 cobalamin biosynthesis protein CbiG [Clostridium pasteurianum BC1]
MKIAVISLNNKGDIIAERIGKSIDIDLYSKTKIKEFNINNITKELMKEYEAVIFLSSTGIAVRSIAPYIKSKDIDPAIIVIDVLGKYVISLLSGHLGGANALSIKLAEIVGALPVITTATDILKVKAPDIIALENNLIIDSLKDAKEISALLVDGKKVAFVDDKNEIDLPEGYINLEDKLESYRLMNSDDHSNCRLHTKEVSLKKEKEQINGIVYVTDKAKIQGFNKAEYNNQKKLKLIRRDVVLGIGCKKNYPAEKMIEQVCEKLEELNIDKRAVKYVATVEIKKDEKAILELNKALKGELKIFTREAIRKVQHKYKGSDFVEKSIGIRAVCEPCVELCGGILLTEKLSISGMTLCVGKA